MKKISVLMVIAAIGMIVASCGNGSNTNVKLSSDIDSAFYAIGVLNGTNFREGLKTLPGAENYENYDALIAGLVTALSDKTSELKMTPEEAQNYMQMYVTTAQTKQFETSKSESEAFLASNGSQAGVITTSSGLQYKVITEGTGKKPTEESTVIVHYTLKLLDGTALESSIERGEPAEFPVTGVIAGWTEVLQLMPVGSKYQVWIPSELAYDAAGPQHQLYGKLLSFEMELLGIKE